MVLELHVWGPAFGLPSIDAECLGAIAYFHRIIPWPQWVLISDFKTSLSPSHEFPFLVDGDAKVAGFANIVLHLRNHPSGAYDLDYNLTHQQQTDRVAFISFLRSTAEPLIDLSLYVSSENYSGITKSAYTAILPWYTNYTIPPRRRDLARTRTAHLGLSGLDVDTANEGDTSIGGASLNREYEAAKQAAGLPSDSRVTQPKILHLGRGKGLSGLLSSPLYAARFKLDGLANELLEPLSEFLGKKDYFFEGDKPSSLDCLAFGYLALMFYPQTPQPWVKEAIQSRFPRILRYIGRMREDFLGKEDVKAADVWSITSSVDNGEEIRARLRELNTPLPWHPNPSLGLGSAAATTTKEMLSSIPLLSSFSSRVIHHTSGSPRKLKTPVSQLPSPLLANSVLGSTAALAAVLAGMAIHHRQNPNTGDLVFSAARPVVDWRGYGEAGDILSVLASRVQG